VREGIETNLVKRKGGINVALFKFKDKTTKHKTFPQRVKITMMTAMKKKGMNMMENP
jgi:hypothetical protein